MERENTYDIRHVKVRRPIPYTHHGIVFPGGRVIHFDGEPGTKAHASVREGRWSDFESPRIGDVQVVDYKRRFPDRLVAVRAEHLLGHVGYHLLLNNCEHYATWVMTGAHDSNQSLFQRAFRRVVDRPRRRRVGRFRWTEVPIRDRLLSHILSAFEQYCRLDEEPSERELGLAAWCGALALEAIADGVDHPGAPIHRQHLRGGPEWEPHERYLETLSSKLAKGCRRHPGSESE